MNQLTISSAKKIKYNLRALPNEISNGISTSVIFSGWNATTYVNQMSEEKILDAEKNNLYQTPTRKVITKHRGLWFNDELLVITKK